jgi:hypothetical protein
MAAGALLIGAAVAAGLWLAAELQNPVSDLRLWIAGVNSNLRGEA